MSLTFEIMESWANKDGNVNSKEDIQNWINQNNEQLKVHIRREKFSYDGFWYMDPKDGYIKTQNNSFFQIVGCQEIEDAIIINEQPIIVQPEIGYLGIICKKIDGVLNFLMQAKIEPGNINKIQISPTIQATKSNFTRRHGGKSPAYLDYFVKAYQYQIIVDQVQSEQASRFMKKRNRNIIIYVEDDVEVLPNFKWMTLGQIKELMKIDNLVNMDTRTVLSCIPVGREMISSCEADTIKEMFSDDSLYESLFGKLDYEEKYKIFNQINDYKMYRKSVTRLVPITSMKSWSVTDREIVCKSPSDFKVIYCYIEIEGREVQYWEQPLIEACSMSTFGLFTAVFNGVRKFMVCIKPEIGSYDGAELGPIVQLEPNNPRHEYNNIQRLFLDKLNRGKGIYKDVVLSEEGGRFYHEQNRNAIIEIDPKEIDEMPMNHFWMDYATLNHMIQFNNCVNIQLRNLLALITI